MSVEEHRKNATGRPVRFAVLVVSTSRTLDDDRSGRRIVELLEGAGHEVVARTLAGDDLDAIRGAVSALEGVDAIIATGGTGLAPLDVTPEAVLPLFARRIDGFGELFRQLSWAQVGAAAMLSRATAGVLANGTVLFALPGSVRGCELAVQSLILPEIGHLVSLVGAASVVAEADPVEGASTTALAPAPSTAAVSAPRSGKWAPAAGTQRSVTMVNAPDATAPVQEGEEDRGWKRALDALGAEVLAGARDDLPEPIEKLAPVTNLLDTAGQVAVLKLANGRRYSLYGWPDLNRPSSKVLAVGWGQPLAEVLALHRYPTPTGTCIEELHGVLPRSTEAVGPMCESVTGRAPKDTSGELFAVSGDAVWIRRGGRVIRWDGRAERDDGSPKQALASLLLEWHAR